MVNLSVAPIERPVIHAVRRHVSRTLQTVSTVTRVSVQTITHVVAAVTVPSVQQIVLSASTTRTGTVTSTSPPAVSVTTNRTSISLGARITFNSALLMRRTCVPNTLTPIRCYRKPCVQNTKRPVTRADNPFPQLL